MSAKDTTAEESFIDNEAQVMEPMEIKSSGTDGGDTKKRKGLFPLCGKGKEEEELTPFQKMFVDQDVLKWSLYTLRFAVFTDSVVSTIEQPNYPIMVSPGLHPDSFPNTGGLGFSAATYFVPMSALLGVAVASLVIGTVSDKVGRKPCILVCLYGSIIGSILKYVLKGSFWGYCGMNFANGLVSASVPVALAYVGDVFTARKEKEAEIGLLVGFSMLGAAGGGMIAILMEPQGLFAPLLVGAAIMALAAIVSTFLLIEPSRELQAPTTGEDDDEDENERAPETLDNKTLWIIVAGALGDNVGSAGLMPLCLSPLAFNAFYTNFIEKGLDPIMSQVAYKWISVLVALMVIPGTMITPSVFNKLGTAGGCILGNVVTGIVTIAELYIGMASPTAVTFGIFVALLYLCFPFTVISQLSTGPMLDTIAPADKRGFVQGLNITVMNFGAAVSPMVLGYLSDAAGTPAAIWTCIGISFLAALINMPLMWKKGLGIPPKKMPDESKPLRGEDKDLIERALRGEWVPAEALEDLNNERREKGQPYLVIHPRKYEDEKDDLQRLRFEAMTDFRFHKKRTKEYMHDINNHEDLPSLCAQINHSIEAADSEQVAEVNKEIGEWFAAYLADAGYYAHLDPQITKQMIMHAFPVINKEKTITPENVGQVLLNTERIYNNYVQLEEGGGTTYNIRRVLAAGASAIHQQSI